MCPGLAEPNNPLSCISADRCLNWKTSHQIVRIKRSLKTYFYVQCFINIVFITFCPRVVDIVMCPWSIFFIYNTLILTILHYITFTYKFCVLFIVGVLQQMAYRRKISDTDFTDILILNYFLEKMWKLGISHAVPPLTIAELSTLTNVRFWPTLYMICAVLRQWLLQQRETEASFVYVISR